MKVKCVECFAEFEDIPRDSSESLCYVCRDNKD